jgi:hypothetical protein
MIAGLVATLSLGWGYVLAAALSSSPWLRWPVLLGLTVALGGNVVPVLSELLTRGVEVKPVTVLLVAGPELALLVGVWSLAIVRARRRMHRMTVRTAMLTTGAVVLYFMVHALESVALFDSTFFGGALLKAMPTRGPASWERWC